MSIILDLIVVLIIAFFVITSAKRGFVRTAIEIVGFFLAFYLSLSLSGIAANFIYDGFVKEPMLAQIEEKADDLIKDSLPTVDLNENDDAIISQNSVEIYNALPQFIVGVAKNYDITPEGFAQTIKNNNDSNATELLLDYAVKPIVVNLIKIILFIILFIVLSILVKWLAKIVNRIFSIPIIGGLNRTLGAVFGLIKGTIIAAAVCIAISFIISFSENGILFVTSQTIENTYIFKILSGLNPLK